MALALRDCSRLSSRRRSRSGSARHKPALSKRRGGGKLPSASHTLALACGIVTTRKTHEGQPLERPAFPRGSFLCPAAQVNGLGHPTDGDQIRPEPVVDFV